MIKDKTIPVFFAVDDHYIHVLHVALTSLADRASKDFNYNIHILFESLTEENRRSFEVFNRPNMKIILSDITDTVAQIKDKLDTRVWSKTIFYRVFIPEMFPEYDKAIYLDCDVILNADISELWSVDLGDNYLGAATCDTVNEVPDFVGYAQNFLGVKIPYYFNSGVLLLNTDMLRKIKLKETLFSLLKKYRLEIAPDQDYLNLICYGRVHLLPLAWNKTPITVGGKEIPVQDIKLVHYNLFNKPWRMHGVMYADLFWKYANKTAYKDVLAAGVQNDLAGEDKTRITTLLKLAGELKNAKVPMLVKIGNPNYKAIDRLEVLEKIALNEKNKQFDHPVEIESPFTKPLDIRKIDFLDRKLVNKVKTKIAYHVGLRFYIKMMKRGDVVMGQARGTENLAGFKGGAVVTCNHINIFDNGVVYRGLEKALGKLRLYKIIKDSNYAIPGKVGFIVRHADTLPISHTNMRLTLECIKATKTLLARGHKVLIYPEQEMWWNYRKPRPIKDGAFVIAKKAGVPVIPCFITLRDSDKIGHDGFPVQEFTLNILPVIPCTQPEEMRKRNEELWAKAYKETYN
ncbi:MAG: 1-acyl-sn-glycerol-3-phosphate acyltransferase [Christensenellaceae bacterium]|jgi:lipopolysaccharide biosynthesis glycosyltransferase|nr:1-acyl-sn-glycerol-3-phosphate acyltransferase [Christensenellaceae bacterium]